LLFAVFSNSKAKPAEGLLMHRERNSVKLV